MTILKRNRIEKLNASRSEMANKLNVSVNTIHAWESGTRHIKTQDLSEVTRAYNFSVVDLMQYLKEVSKKGNIQCNI